MSQAYQYIFKTISVGDGNCGKTALTVRYTQGIFRDSYQMTIGVNWATKFLKVGDQDVKLFIWDTGGQDNFANVRALYYKGSAGALCVFDLTNRESFEHVPKWMEEIKVNAHEVPVVLVGNKADLPNRQVTKEEAEALAQKIRAKYVESSAKTGEGVGDCYAIIAEQMLKNHLQTIGSSQNTEAAKTR